MLKLIDRINHDLLTSLTQVVDREAFLLTLNRGSMIQTRFKLAQTNWQRIVICFELDEIISELERAYDKPRVESALNQIKTKIIANLLRDRDKMGPAKLMARLKNPDETLLAPGSYPAIESFVDQIARLEEECEDHITREILENTDLGEAQSSVISRLWDLLERFKLDHVKNRITQHWDQFLHVQKSVRCLHPIFPITTADIFY